MPIKKSRQALYGVVLGSNLNRGVSKATAKKRAEKAATDPKNAKAAKRADAYVKADKKKKRK